VNTYDFGGWVALVTGGGSGIGAGTVELEGCQNSDSTFGHGFGCERREGCQNSDSVRATGVLTPCGVKKLGSGWHLGGGGRSLRGRLSVTPSASCHDAASAKIALGRSSVRSTRMVRGLALPRTPNPVRTRTDAEC
jgi:hypothetical protein